jgi:Ca2+-binding EF-hand superfamily protein
VPLFTQEELENIFNLYDLKQEGRISRFKAKEALKSIASTQFQFEKVKDLEEIPERVDITTFKTLW